MFTCVNDRSWARFILIVLNKFYRTQISEFWINSGANVQF